MSRSCVTGPRRYARDRSKFPTIVPKAGPNAKAAEVKVDETAGPAAAPGSSAPSVRVCRARMF